jgi:enterochelin esterase-like enzyme
LEYPVVYLLHGRGESMIAWARVQKELDPLIASGKIPPLLAVIPDFPSQSAAGYYIDSLYAGSESPGEAVESAFFKELIPFVDKNWRTIASRQGRIAGGYSMGGYGAMRYLLAHPAEFFAAIVLSPAVYNPLPPADSSTREFGAFGVGNKKFDEARYTSLNYEAVFPAFQAAALKSYLFIAVGDDEFMHPQPVDREHDLDFEAHKLYNRARRIDYLASELRVYDGSHSWDVWLKGFSEGIQYLSRFVAQPKPR